MFQGICQPKWKKGNERFSTESSSGNVGMSRPGSLCRRKPGQCRGDPPSLSLSLCIYLKTLQGTGEIGIACFECAAQAVSRSFHCSQCVNPKLRSLVPQHLMSMATRRWELNPVLVVSGGQCWPGVRWWDGPSGVSTRPLGCCAPGSTVGASRRRGPERLLL